MPVDTQQIMDEATKLGDIVAQHPAVSRYKDARKAIEQDPDANRLLSEFDRQIEALQRQQQAGMPVTDAQQQSLEALQSRIVSHLKIKALNLAQVEFVDLLRRITQTIQSRLNLQDAPPGGGPGAPAAGGGPRISGMGPV
ncbi:MAG TPA: YlbF family regulator [Tepidisphaeraceae bacterium]|nr:YlbF family regulator [Tepidisphaeraceae bacterium]